MSKTSPSRTDLAMLGSVSDESVVRRFFSLVKKSNECWSWTGGVFRDRYGAFSVRHSVHVRAHRFSYLLHNGSMDFRLVVCHTCDNRKCVRPDHLFLGTIQDNVQDACDKGLILAGERHYRYRVTPEMVLEIRRSLQTDGGYGSARRLANRFGVSESVVSRIRHGLYRNS